MKKIYYFLLFGCAALSAEYSTQRAIEIMHDMVDLAVEGVKLTGNQREFSEVQEKAYLELLELNEHMTQDQMSIIEGELQKAPESEENIKAAREFHKKIRGSLLKLSIADCDQDLLAIYEELLPIIASDIENARIFFKVFAYRSGLSFDDVMGKVPFYALFHDESGKLLAAAIAGSRYPFSGSNELANFYI